MISKIEEEGRTCLALISNIDTARKCIDVGTKNRTSTIMMRLPQVWELCGMQMRQLPGSWLAQRCRPSSSLSSISLGLSNVMAVVILEVEAYPSRYRCRMIRRKKDDRHGVE